MKEPELGAWVGTGQRGGSRTAGGGASAWAGEGISQLLTSNPWDSDFLLYFSFQLQSERRATEEFNQKGTRLESGRPPAGRKH
jgi:hypothetical protein